MAENKEELSIEEMFDRLGWHYADAGGQPQHAGRIVCVV